MIQCNILNRLLKQVWTESSVPILSVCHFYITPGRATKTLAVMHQRLCGQAVSITGEWPSGWHSGSDWRDSEGEQWVSKTLHSSPLSCGLWSKTGRWAKETDAKWLFPWCIIIPWKQKKTHHWIIVPSADGLKNVSKHDSEKIKLHTFTPQLHDQSNIWIHLCHQDYENTQIEVWEIWIKKKYIYIYNKIK